MLKGIFASNPNIESFDSHEDADGAHIKLVLKRPVCHYAEGFYEDINKWLGD